MPEAMAATVHAGINQYLDDYKPAMEEALSSRLDQRGGFGSGICRGCFCVMMRLGMLDPASDGSAGAARIGFDDGAGKMLVKDPWWTPEAKALARKVTDESIVLLKNEAEGVEEIVCRWILRS